MLSEDSLHAFGGLSPTCTQRTALRASFYPWGFPTFPALVFDKEQVKNKGGNTFSSRVSHPRAPRGSPGFFLLLQTALGAPNLSGLDLGKEVVKKGGAPFSIQGLSAGTQRLCRLLLLPLTLNCTWGSPCGAAMLRLGRKEGRDNQAVIQRPQ